MTKNQLYYGLSLLIFIFTLNITTVYSTEYQKWDSLGALTDAAYPAALDIVVTPDGSQIYALHTIDGGIGNVQIVVDKWDGTNWNLLGQVYVGYSTSEIKMCMGVDGTLYVAYITNIGDVFAKKWDGTAWVDVDSAGGAIFPSTQSTINQLSIACGSSAGEVYVGFHISDTQLNLEVLRVLQYTTANSWVTIEDGITDTYSNVFGSAKISFNSNTNKINSAAILTNGGMIIKEYDNVSAWNIVGDTIWGNFSGLDFLIAPNGARYIAYKDNSTTFGYVSTFDGVIWSLLGGVSFNTNSSSSDLSIAVETTTNSIYVHYTDGVNNNSNVSQLENGIWVNRNYGGVYSTYYGLTTQQKIITDNFGGIYVISSNLNEGNPHSMVNKLCTAPTIDYVSTTTPNCYGDVTGGAVTGAIGGRSPYTYAWSNGTTTNNLNNAVSGTYTLTLSDANGCVNNTGSVTITQPTALSVPQGSTLLLTCNGGTYSSLLASVTGGSDPYSYLWSNGATTASLTGIPANTYTYTVTDNKGCVKKSNVTTITEPSAITVTATITNPSCFGGSGGAINASASGGRNTIYTYNWSNQVSTPNNIKLYAGSYVVSVTDYDGCSPSPTAVTLVEPTQININLNTSNISCFGSIDGAIATTVVGGTSPYSFLWNIAANSTNQNISNLASGTYNLSLEDANACTASATTSITEPNALSLSATTADPACFGNSDGYIYISPYGGTTPYNYIWGNGATTGSLTGLVAGSYYHTITDANNCTTTASDVLVDPTAITSTITVTDVSCYNGISGSINVLTVGGASPYSYLWGHSITLYSNTATELSAGNYIYTVTDNNGCKEISNTITVTEPLILSINISTTNVSCFGLSDGAGSITVSGGTNPYTYSWNPSLSNTTNSASGLSPGNYTVDVSDNNSCYGTAYVYINEPSSALATSIDYISNPTCNGDSNGSIDLLSYGGTPSYTYLWNNGSTTSSISTGSGNYAVTVTDANNCTASTNTTLTEPTSIVLNTTTTDASCSGNSDGSILVEATGGVLPYSYLWSNGATTSSNLTGLNSGSYSITLTDNNNCSTSISSTLTEAITLSTTTTITDISCEGASDGVINIDATGGVTPYSYAWNSPLNNTNNSATGLAPGNYTLSITDNQGCTANVTTTLIAPTAITITPSTTDATCNGTATGGLNVNVSGGTPTYSYLWSNSVTAPSVGGITAGTFEITITDSNDCMAIESNIVIAEPSAITITSTESNVSCNGGTNGTISIAAIGGTTPYTYAWNNNSSTLASNTGLSANIYIVTITDENNCIDTISVSLSEPNFLDLLYTINTVSCNGESNGSIEANVSGGTTPYLYLWENGTSTSTILGLAMGTYAVSITDENGCNVSGNTFVSEPATITVTATVQDALCFGGNSGAISTTVTGGTTPYTYIWNNNLTFGTIINLAAGNYVLTLTDNNGCIDNSANATVNQSSAILVAATNITGALCGSSNGGITVDATGGTSPYNYLWENGVAGSSVSNVLSGAYQVTITDGNGCDKVHVTMVQDTDGPLISIVSVTDANCGGNDGTIETTVSGGVAPLTFEWSNGVVFPNNYFAQAGENSIIVTDANGCAGVATTFVNQQGINPPTITGIITLPGGITFANGVVRIFTDNPYQSQMDSIVAAIIGTDGSYTFNNVQPVGNYILRVEPDSILFPNVIATYYNGSAIANVWDDAEVVVATCDAVYNYDVELTEVAIMDGFTKFSGIVQWDTTGGNRAGEPIPGIGIAIKQSPGGIIATTTTDTVSTSEGEFTFNNIPTMISSDTLYEVRVDIPGLPMESQYSFILTNDTVIDDLNFFVGDSSVYIQETSTAIVEIRSTASNSTMSIFPNPYSESTTIKYSLKESGNVRLEVFNLLGERVTFTNYSNQLPGEYNIQFSAKEYGYPSGMYIVKLNVGTEKHILRIVETQ